eukprot:10232025-Alexandrium_andersonii.AAC.1
MFGTFGPQARSAGVQASASLEGLGCMKAVAGATNGCWSESEVALGAVQDPPTSRPPGGLSGPP